MFILGQKHFGKLFIELCFLKKCCVMTLLYNDCIWKCIIFLVAYGEMHDLLAWKRLASLIKILRMCFMDSMHYLQILKMLYLSLYYLGNLCKIFMTRNGFEDFENIVDIWLLKYFTKLLGSELWISNTLTCEFLMWFCHCAMILMIIPSLWQWAKLEPPTLLDIWPCVLFSISFWPEAYS